MRHIFILFFSNINSDGLSAKESRDSLFGQFLILDSEHFPNILGRVSEKFGAVFERADWAAVELVAGFGCADPDDGAGIAALGLFETHDDELVFLKFLVLLQVVAAIVDLS